ncbi:MAG: hypothetical protein A3I61_05005 [Acidobacteria bacterium RIFCSPLOWO2_02_FULL_68_18]|nr:MAG: hypothetical protein A3I61_05005 [Acidobacteria bacterium RIFCSPLOWO2_02_FULL_68_18]OFW49094.1 MAG: hypothetical protein A3G77_10025 [Acidobacteria bacterium RIFCSPLOWO2_12_FULL_68_19]
MGGGNNHGGAFNNGNGGGKDGSGRGKDKERVDDTDDADAGGDGDDDHGDRRNLSGFVTAVGADSITIRGVIVKITPSTVIRHGHRRLSLAQIAVGDHAQAKGLISADGTMMTATEIKVEDTGNDNDDEEVELSGAVADLSGTCPSVTFKIGTTTVATSASTTFAGIACSALVNGTRVEVEGTLSGTTLTATKVELD